MLATFAEQIAVEGFGPGEYMSKCVPESMGNALPIAYGGCTLANAVYAACLSVQPSFNLYSVPGHYLRPASTEQKLTCRVQILRDTRSFATRRVEVWQLQKGGKEQLCLLLVADFILTGPALLTYSAPPSRAYSDFVDSLTVEAIEENLRAKGQYSEKQLAIRKVVLGLGSRYFESRYCPEGVSGQNLSGLRGANKSVRF